MKKVARLRLHKKYVDPDVYAGDEFERIMRNMRYKELPDDQIERIEHFIMAENRNIYNKYFDLLIVMPDTDTGWAELVQYIREIIAKLQVHNEQLTDRIQETLKANRRRAETTNKLIQERGFKWKTKKSNNDTE